MLTVALRALSLRVLRVLRTTIKRKIVFSRYQVLSQYIKTVFGSYYQSMMRGINRDSSGKMGHQTSCGTTSTGSAPEEREPGALSEQQSLVAPSVPAALHVTHRQYNQDSSITAWANNAVTPYITPSEEWCALRELRVTDTYRDGHLPRCKHDTRTHGARHSFCCRDATWHASAPRTPGNAVSRVTALIRVLSETPLLSMPRTRQRHQSHSKARRPAATPPPTSSCSLLDRI